MYVGPLGSIWDFVLPSVEWRGLEAPLLGTSEMSEIGGPGGPGNL